MAAPFAPLPLGRPLCGGRRTASLGSVSSQSTNQGGVMEGAESILSPTPHQSPVVRARLRGSSTAVEFCVSPREERGPLAEEPPLVPIMLGYEVMEERAKFTVYKILVRPTEDESWIVFRRYADFSRLNDKLKEVFPEFRLSLPPKRWFKGNYDAEFLEARQVGLQAFLKNLVAHKDVSQCPAVREFLCLDDPPGPFDSLEESRAFCETLEESNYRMQRELLEKQQEVDALKNRLKDLQLRAWALEKRLRKAPAAGIHWKQDNGSSKQAESSAVEEDQDIIPDRSCGPDATRFSTCWCGPSISSSPPALQVLGPGQENSHGTGIRREEPEVTVSITHV